MKKLILILATSLLSTAAFAGDVDFSDAALRSLLAANPSATSGENSGGVKVSDLLASMMTSSFDSSGNGALSVISNSCEQNSDNIRSSCTLNILNSDRKIGADGSYEPADGMTESSLSIQYEVGPTGEITGAPVTFMFAG